MIHARDNSLSRCIHQARSLMLTRRSNSKQITETHLLSSKTLWMKTLTMMGRVMMGLSLNARTHHLSIMSTTRTCSTQSTMTNTPTSKPRKCSKCSTCALPLSLTRRSTNNNSHSSLPQAIPTLLSARTTKR
jgi:hypothetical protein